MVYYSSSGKFLTRESLVIQVREALTAAGLDTKYPGSSFTQEAATTVLEKEISDAVIKMLGRWKNNAYAHYIWM